MPFDWQTIVAGISVIVAFASWVTSARKSRVDNLCQIIDSQAEHIAELRNELMQAQTTIKALQRELAQAKSRITELETLNSHYRTLLKMNHIDPGELHA